MPVTQTMRRIEEIIFLLPEKGVMPVSDIVLVYEALHLLHLALIRQDDHHGGVALVGQHDHRGVVVVIIIKIIAACPAHHVHLHLGGLVYVEVSLFGEVAVEGFLPLTCAAKG